LETGWLADFVYYGGEFHSGVAMFAGADGRITRFSREPDDLRRARRWGAGHSSWNGERAFAHIPARDSRAHGTSTAAQRDTFWTWREAMYHAAIDCRRRRVSRGAHGFSRNARGGDYDGR
jgi:hypothetical protein